MIKTISDERIIKIALDHGPIDFRDIAGHNVVTLPDSYMSELFKFAHDIIREIEQAPAAEPAQAVPVAWLPIETAPKDGTEILVTYGKQGFVMKLVRFDRTFNYWISKGEAELGLENNATHWMPIPDPRKPLYTVPPAIDDETRRMVVMLCESIIDAEDLEVLADDVIDFNLPKQILEKLEAGA